MEIVNTESIEKVLKTTTITTLSKNYTDRHEREQQENEVINKRVLEEFGENTSLMSKPSSCHFRNELIGDLILINNYSDADEKMAFSTLLSKYNYKEEYEFFWIFSYIDKYLSNKMSFEEALKYIRGFLTYKQINEKYKGVFELITHFGNVELVSAENLQQFSFDERKNACHKLIGTALRTWDKMDGIYGAYYYLPFNFKGGFDHSVLYDSNNSTIIDLTNNLIIPYEFYKKLFGIPNFIINQHTFNMLDRMMNEQFGCYLTMDTIEEVHRIRKKQG